MLRVRDLAAAYTDQQVVQGISLDVAPGRVACLIGSNGAGKTTTLKTMVGLVRRVGGSIALNDEDIRIAHPVDALARGIALVPEGRGILAGLTVRENLLVGGFKIRDTATMNERLDQVYDMFPRLRERARVGAGLLSGGEQQMLAIGRALMTAPAFLLLDEPSMGLSPLLVDSVAALIRDLADSGIGVLLAEQNAQMALGISDFGYVIEQGRIALSGAAESIVEDDGVRTAYLGLGET